MKTLMKRLNIILTFSCQIGFRLNALAATVVASVFVVCADAANNVAAAADTTPPVVTITSPQNASSLQPNTSMQVTVNASDDVAVDAMWLHWNNSGSDLPCPGSSPGAWSCTRSGNTAVWTLQVTTGDRSFYGKATDSSGNVGVSSVTTVHLSGPPADTTLPVVTIISPQNG